MSEGVVHIFGGKKANPQNHGVYGEAEHFSRSGESDVNFESPNGIALSPEKQWRVDSALNVAGFLPGDVEYADVEGLKAALEKINDAPDPESEKLAVKELLRVIQLGVNA